MNIGFLANEYPPLRSGGIGTSVQNLARALVRDGHRVSVIGWAGEESFDDHGVRVHMVGASRVPKTGWLLNRRRARRALCELARGDGLDVVEAPDWCGPSAGLSLPCPLVVRCHGSATYFAHLEGGSVRASVRWAERLALGGADAIGAVSRFAGDLTRRLFALRRPVATLANGIDLERFTAADPAAVEPDTVLYLGALVRKKGVLDLGPIFSRVVERRPRARLLLLGRDCPDPRSGQPSTWALVRERLSPAARKRAEHLGTRPYHQVQDVLRRAAVCLYPSYAEALPLAWLEAMACARPVIAYDIGWAPEVIVDGEDGLLLRRGDVGGFAAAVVALLADPARGARLGAAARATVETRFAAPVVARQSVRWYREAIGGAA